MRLGALVVALAVLTGLLASAINGEVLFARWTGRELKMSEAPGLWLAGLLAASLLVAATTWGLVRHSEVLLPVHSVEPDGAPHPCQGVMVFLSLPQARAEISRLRPEQGRGLQYAPTAGIVPLLLPATGDGPQLDRWLALVTQWQEDRHKETGQRVQWNWLPMMRALQPHMPELKRVCILASNETLAHTAAARALIAMASGLPEAQVTVAPPFDIEDFDAAYSTMATVVQEWEAEGIAASRVMIDITGGSRPGCIAGAMLTLDRDVTFQHLEQHYPFTRLVAYRKRFELQQKLPSV